MDDSSPLSFHNIKKFLGDSSIPKCLESYHRKIFLEAVEVCEFASQLNSTVRDTISPIKNRIMSWEYPTEKTLTLVLDEKPEYEEYKSFLDVLDLTAIYINGGNPFCCVNFECKWSVHHYKDQPLYPLKTHLDCTIRIIYMLSVQEIREHFFNFLDRELFHMHESEPHDFGVLTKGRAHIVEELTAEWAKQNPFITVALNTEAIPQYREIAGKVPTLLHTIIQFS